MKHKHTAVNPDDTTNRVQPSHWNERHIWVAEAEPSDSEVSVGQAIEWMSNGTGYGDAGDLCVKINSGGSIKKAVRTPFTLIS